MNGRNRSPGPEVSVVMAVHNCAQHVMFAVDSIRLQTFGEWELVIVDDGSVDHTSAVIEEAARMEPRIRLLRQNQNRGLASSLNLGWRTARAGLIARMDADDISLNHRLARQVEFMRHHPEIGVLGTAVELVNDEGQVVGRAEPPEGHDDLVRKLYKKNPFIHPTVMMRREVLEALGGYDETLRRAQDFDLWLRAYRQFRFHNLPDITLRYRVRRRPPASAVLWGTWALARGAAREGRLISRGWYAVRFLVAGTAGCIGARKAGLR